MAKENNNSGGEGYAWAVLRISLGWIFLWAFFDKLFGLGFSTSADKAWIIGTSPTYSFLKFATVGPFSNFYQSITGNAIVDWIFMIGLLLIGIALIAGICLRIAGYSGALMLFLMYTAGFLPPKNNPFMDEHIIYIIILLWLAMTKSEQRISLEKWWTKTKLVGKFSFLR